MAGKPLPDLGRTETEGKQPLRVLEILLPREADDQVLHNELARALPGRSLTPALRFRRDELASGSEELRWTLDSTGADHRAEAAALRAALGARASKLKIRAHVCNHQEGLPCGPWEDL